MLVPEIWHRIISMGKYQGLYTGMKFCSICKCHYLALVLQVMWNNGCHTIKLLLSFLFQWPAREQFSWNTLSRYLPAHWVVVFVSVYWTSVLFKFVCMTIGLILHLFSTFCSDVRNNSLSGSIPENIGNCTAFQVLYVSHLTSKVKIVEYHT